MTLGAPSGNEATVCSIFSSCSILLSRVQDHCVERARDERRSLKILHTCQPCLDSFGRFSPFVFSILWPLWLADKAPRHILCPWYIRHMRYSLLAFCLVSRSSIICSCELSEIGNVLVPLQRAGSGMVEIFLGPPEFGQAHLHPGTQTATRRCQRWGRVTPDHNGFGRFGFALDPAAVDASAYCTTVNRGTLRRVLPWAETSSRPATA